MDIFVDLVPEIIVAIVVSFLGACVHIATDRFSETRRKKQIIAGALLLVLASAGSALFYYAAQQRVDDSPLATTSLVVAYSTFFAILASGSYLASYMYRAAAIKMENQYDDPVKVRFRGPNGGDRIRRVRSLSYGNLERHERLYLTWGTFWDGTKHLVEQIEANAPAITPDLCVGINVPGSIIASFLCSQMSGGSRILGYVEVKGDDHKVDEDTISLPDPETAIRSILIVDLEVKRGKSLRNVRDFLLKRYGGSKTLKSHMKTAVLVASGVTELIEDIKDLRKGHRGMFDEDAKYLPDFLAFVSRNIVRLEGDVR